MKEKLRKLWVSLATLFVVLPSATTVLATTVNPTTTSGEPVVKRDGCKRVIEKTEQVKWELPRQPIDLVILQDASGSFEKTIGNVKSALNTLLTPTTFEKYDEKILVLFLQVMRKQQPEYMYQLTKVDVQQSIIQL